MLPTEGEKNSNGTKKEEELKKQISFCGFSYLIELEFVDQYT